MLKVLARPVVGTVLSVLVLAGVIAPPAQAAPADYRFQVTGPAVASPVEASGRGYTVTVALVHAPSGTRISNAEVLRRETVLRDKIGPRIDERHVPLTPAGLGNYRLTTYYPLTAGSQLKLGARVRGETGTVRGVVYVDRPN